MNMEGILVEVEDILKKVIVELEALQRKNEALKRRNVMSREDPRPSQDDREEEESQSTCKPLNNEDEKNKNMYHDLRNLMDKYEEMAQKIGTSSLVDQLLISAD